MTTYSDCSLGRLVAQFGKGLGSKWLKLKSLHDFEPVESTSQTMCNIIKTFISLCNIVDAQAQIDAQLC